MTKLSDDQMNALIAMYAGGIPLCCADGRVHISLVVDDADLVEAIVSFAHEALGCDTDFLPGGRHYAFSLLRLRDFLSRLRETEVAGDPSRP